MKKIIISLLVLVISGVSAYYLYPLRPTQVTQRATPTQTDKCEIAQRELRVQLSDSRMCESDEDCVINKTPLQCPFECDLSAINKNENPQEYQTEVGAFVKQCPNNKCTGKCSASQSESAAAVCVDSRCTNSATVQK